MSSLRILAPVAAAAAVVANMIDIVEPSMSTPTECGSYGCAVWSDIASSGNTIPQAEIDAQWANATAQQAAGSACAMPAYVAFAQERAAAVGGDFVFTQGPRCYCAAAPGNTTRQYGFCGDPIVPTPQQINLQFGSSEWQLAVGFVTLDHGAQLVSPPIVELCDVSQHCVNVTGSSIVAPAPQQPLRVYTFHTVQLPVLQPASTYTYRCRGGTSVGAWSASFTFTTRDPAAPTRFALFGDMGVYSYNNMGNLVSDVANGLISAVMMLGDHAYNLAMDSGLRGDGYMYGFQPTLSRVPWLPVIGNHEFEGSPFGAYCPASENCVTRYTNQTAGLLAAANASGSPTNRYYSVDVGLVHFISLDYTYYLGLTPKSFNDAQLAWLEQDLASASAPAQRAAVPWIIIGAHVPLYCTDIYLSEAERRPGVVRDIPGVCESDELIADIEPLMLKYAVDLHAAGHNHAYESMWPISTNGTVPAKSFDNPRAPVHVLTGAGGAPAFDTFTAPAVFTRVQLVEWCYSRVTVWNATTLTFEQIRNNDSSVSDVWTITSASHGPFV